VRGKLLIDLIAIDRLSLWWLPSLRPSLPLLTQRQPVLISCKVATTKGIVFSAGNLTTIKKEREKKETRNRISQLTPKKIQNPL
jgi:hypothetical protein